MPPQSRGLRAPTPDSVRIALRGCLDGLDWTSAGRSHLENSGTGFVQLRDQVTATMDKVTLTCPSCQTRYRISEQLLGKSGRCQKCNARFVLSLFAETITDAPGAVAGEDPGKVEGDSSRTLPWESHAGQSSSSSEKDVHEVWSEGDIILGVYEVKRMEGIKGRRKHYTEGGMGFVYRVLHRGWDLDLAVKSPKPAAFETEQGKENFERECKTWIDLGHHPNIVTCYYVRRLGGIPRVFAEFGRDGSLEDWIQNRKLYQGGPSRALERILDIAIQFCWGLKYAHEQGLVHQDVKPDNVMMIGGVPKVTDFGLAKARLAAGEAVAEAAAEREFVSWAGMTPAFCSPEQVEASEQARSGFSSSERAKLTHCTDIWSWAVSILAMFCGAPPCPAGGHTAAKVFKAYCKEPSASDILPNIPERLAILMARCFRRDPDDRPQGFDEVVDELIEIYRKATGNEYPRQEPVTTELKADGLNNRAASLLDLGRLDEADRLLEEAWECHPWHPQVAHNRGLLLWRAGRITDTDLIHHVEEVRKTRPDDWTAAYSLGLIQFERGALEQAVEAFEDALLLGGGYEVQDVMEEARSLLPDAPRCVQSFVGRLSGETAVFVSSDERWALVETNDRGLRLCCTSTGRLGMTFDVPSEGSSSFSSGSDGCWELSVDEQKTLRLEDGKTGRGVRTFHAIDWGAQSTAENADGRWTLSADVEEYTLQLHNASNGRLAGTFRGHTGPVTAVFLSADARWAASGSADKTLRVWEVRSGRCLRTIRGHGGTVDSVFLGRDGNWAFSGSEDRTFRVWNLELLADAEKRFVSPTLLCLITSSEEARRVHAKLADLRGKATAATDAGDYGEALDLVRAIRDLPGYEVDRKALELWARVGSRSRRTGPRKAWCMQTFEGHTKDVCSVSLSADGRRVVSGSWDGSLRLWGVDSGRCLQTFAGHTDAVRAVSLAPDGRRVLSGSWDKTLRLWDVDTGECLQTFLGHSNYVNSVCLSPDGDRALSGGWDKTLRLWDTDSGACLSAFEAHADYVSSVCLSADGRWALSGSEDKTARLWDVATGERLRIFEGHTDWVTSVCLGADCRRAVSAGKDWTIRLWSLATGRCERVFEGHSGMVTSVCLSPDGRWVLSGSKDRTVRLWETATGKCLRTMRGHTDLVTSVSMTPDGRWALSGSADWGLRLWEIDWDYQFPGLADWDEAARPFLETFLYLRCPLDNDGIRRTGRPQWNEIHLEQLLTELRHCGYGWLKPEGVKEQLETMTSEWQGPSPLIKDA